ncbi:MAG: DUF192 domain-containing protein [Geobacter sp.]|nr:MAG: DUF192 domain-containing protein [Geobacter sp.]
MRAFLPEKGMELGNDISLAASLPARLKGLLGKNKLEAGKGLLISPCKGIHTFFMKFPIDAVFLNKDNRIVALVRSFPPNRMTSIYLKASSVLELPAGTLGVSVVVGDAIEFI